MKKIVIAGLALLLVVGVGSIVFAHGPGYGRGYGMGYGMGYGPMHGYMNGGTGSGWGAGGYGNGPCWFSPGTTGEKVTKDSAKKLLENRLAYWQNPNLKVGKIVEKDDYFVGEIVTKDNSLVQKLQIDKNTGFTRPVN